MTQAQGQGQGSWLDGLAGEHAATVTDEAIAWWDGRAGHTRRLCRSTADSDDEWTAMKASIASRQDKTRIEYKVAVGQSAVWVRRGTDRRCISDTVALIGTRDTTTGRLVFTVK